MWGDTFIPYGFKEPHHGRTRHRHRVRLGTHCSTQSRARRNHVSSVRRLLRQQRGQLLSTPTDLTIGAYDVHLGDIGGVPFYISASQYEYWKHTQLIIDVTDGHGGTFSLEGSTGKAFLTRSRLFTDEEWAQLQAQGVV